MTDSLSGDNPDDSFRSFESFHTLSASGPNRISLGEVDGGLPFFEETGDGAGWNNGDGPAVLQQACDGAGWDNCDGPAVLQQACDGAGWDNCDGPAVLQQACDGAGWDNSGNAPEETVEQAQVEVGDDDLRARIRFLEAELAFSRAECANNTDIIRFLQNENPAKAQRFFNIQEKKGDLQRLTGRVQDLESKLSAIRSENKELKIQNDRYQCELYDMRCQVFDVRQEETKKDAQYQSKLKDLSAQLSAVKEEYTAYRTEMSVQGLESLKNQNDRLQGEIRAIHTGWAASRRENTELRDQLKRQETEIGLASKTDVHAVSRILHTTSGTLGQTKKDLEVHKTKLGQTKKKLNGNSTKQSVDGEKVRDMNEASGAVAADDGHKRRKVADKP